MSSYRMDRTSEDIKRELTAILRTVKDPRVTGLVSIVRVEVSSDLSYAKIHISSMDGLEAAKTAVHNKSTNPLLFFISMTLFLSGRHTRPIIVLFL